MTGNWGRPSSYYELKMHWTWIWSHMSFALPTILNNKLPPTRSGFKQQQCSIFTIWWFGWSFFGGFVWPDPCNGTQLNGQMCRHIQNGFTHMSAGTAGCQLEHLGSLPRVHSCEPGWPSFSMAVSGQSSSGAINGLVLSKLQLAQLIPMNSDSPLAKSSRVSKARVNMDGNLDTVSF